MFDYFMKTYDLHPDIRQLIHKQFKLDENELQYYRKNYFLSAIYSPSNNR